MAVMTATTIVRLRKSDFRPATGTVVIFCPLSPDSRHRVNVDSAKLFATFPTPRAPTPCANNKGAMGRKPTCKNIVAGCIFESPSLTPGTLLCTVFIAFIVFTVFIVARHPSAGIEKVRPHMSDNTPVRSDHCLTHRSRDCPQ